MSVELFGHVAIGALIASFLVAAICVGLGVARRASARQLAWVCAATAFLVLAGGLAGWLLAMSSAYASAASGHPAERASILARGISEAFNCGALAAIGVLPPGLASIVLFARARKAR